MAESVEISIKISYKQKCGSFCNLIYCISGKVHDVEIFANFANPRNSRIFFQVQQGTILLKHRFPDSRTFPHAKRLELQICELFDTHRYPLKH